MNNNTQIKLEDLSTHEKFILGLIGDHEQKPKEEQEKYELKVVGIHARRDANYLVSLGLVEYCGSGRYKLTDIGSELYFLRELKFKQNSEPISEQSKNELITN